MPQSRDRREAAIASLSRRRLKATPVARRLVRGRRASQPQPTPRSLPAIIVVDTTAEELAVETSRGRGNGPTHLGQCPENPAAALPRRNDADGNAGLTGRRPDDHHAARRAFTKQPLAGCQESESSVILMLAVVAVEELSMLWTKRSKSSAAILRVGCGSQTGRVAAPSGVTS